MGLLSEGMSPDFPPVTLEMAVSNFVPKRCSPSNGIRHQLDLDAGSAVQGLSHKALLAITEANIDFEADLIVSTEASATKSPARLNSCNAFTIFSWSAPSNTSFSVFEDQLEMALPTAASAIAGLHVPKGKPA